MAVPDREVIDLVAHHPESDMVLLVLVEVRTWGERGELLPELQAKLNTYLGYAMDGQLAHDYPHLVGKRVAIQLSYAHPPGPREREFIELVCREYLEPEGIAWREEHLSAA